MDGRRPSVSSLRGIVAAGHPQAAQAGAAILRAGGNAFDAAAATAAALNVTEPYMSGLAGMGMATCYIAAERRVRTLDFITRVPSEFPAGRFTSREELARGPIAAGTPGNLAGWCELVRCLWQEVAGRGVRAGDRAGARWISAGRIQRLGDQRHGGRVQGPARVLRRLGAHLHQRRRRGIRQRAAPARTGTHL